MEHTRLVRIGLFVDGKSVEHVITISLDLRLVGIQDSRAWGETVKC